VHAQLLPYFLLRSITTDLDYNLNFTGELIIVMELIQRPNLPLIALAALLLVSLASAQGPFIAAWGKQIELRTGTDTLEGSWVDVASPPKLVNLSSLEVGAYVVGFSQGSRHGAIVSSDGKVYTWGSTNYDGSSMGGGTSKVHELIWQSQSHGLISDVLCGDTVCFALESSTGNVYGWGEGDLVPINTPTLLTVNSGGTTWNPTSRLSKFFPGSAYHFAGLRLSDGKLIMWGQASDYQLGAALAEEVTDPIEPTEVWDKLNNALISDVALGAYHTLVRTIDGVLCTFGKNNFGQVGRTGDPNLGPDILVVEAGQTVASIAAGNYHSLALSSSGKIYVWGSNSTGQLGPSNSITVSYSDQPTELKFGLSGTGCLNSAPNNVQQIAAVADTSFILLTDGSMYSWGDRNDKMTMRLDDNGAPGKTSFQCSTWLQSVLPPNWYIARIVSTPIPSAATTYAGFAMISVNPAPETSPSASVTPPSTLAPLAPLAQPTSTTPETSPPLSSPPPPCPLPEPQPLGMFECRNGTWVAPGGVSGPGTITIGTPIVVIGNWSTNGTVIITNPGQPITVTGCLTLEGPIQVEIDPSNLLPRQVDLFIAGCISSVSSTLDVRSTTKSCKKISAETKEREENGLKIVSAVFTTNDFKCKVWWIVLVSVIGGLIILVAIFLIVVFSVPSLRNWFKPFARRSEKANGPAKLQ
jgi:alpha-tubulin suppressor-like RCC1 family protein